MATKVNLIAALNGFITAVITSIKHRSANNAIVDEIYPVAVIDTEILETLTTKAVANFPYNITVIKSGNVAHIKGRVRNNTPNILISAAIFTWKENQYKPNANSQIIFDAETSTNVKVKLLLNNGALLTIRAFAPSILFYEFDFKTYITQD